MRRGTPPRLCSLTNYSQPRPVSVHNINWAALPNTMRVTPLALPRRDRAGSHRPQLGNTQGAAGQAVDIERGLALPPWHLPLADAPMSLGLIGLAACGHPNAVLDALQGLAPRLCARALHRRQ